MFWAQISTHFCHFYDFSLIIFMGLYCGFIVFNVYLFVCFYQLPEDEHESIEAIRVIFLSLSLYISFLFHTPRWYSTALFLYTYIHSQTRKTDENGDFQLFVKISASYGVTMIPSYCGKIYLI